jgi:hypothetical protein
VVRSGVDYPLTVTLSPYSATGSLKIVVKKSDGTPNTNTGVRVQWRSVVLGTVTDAYLNSQGVVLVPNLTPGDYEARVRTDSSHNTAYSRATVVAGEEAIINLTSDYNPH